MLGATESVDVADHLNSLLRTEMLRSEIREIKKQPSFCFVIQVAINQTAKIVGALDLFGPIRDYSQGKIFDLLFCPLRRIQQPLKEQFTIYHGNPRLFWPPKGSLSRRRGFSAGAECYRFWVGAYFTGQRALFGLRLPPVRAHETPEIARDR